MTAHRSHSALKLRSKAQRRPYISLTPLIDVVFILLVFFMLASSFLDWRAIELKAPATAGTSGGETGALLLRVGREGTLDFNGQAVETSALVGRLRSAANERQDARLLIQPAAGVPMQKAIDLLDMARDAGLQRVQLIRGAGDQR
jgi:biopolymer transport protein ExbD